jgi:hypothetical protein
MPSFAPEKHKGANALVLDWDSTGRNMDIEEVSGRELPLKIRGHGGYQYSTDKEHLDKGIAGASGKGITARIVDRINEASKESLNIDGGTGEALSIVQTMGADAERFALPTSQFAFDMVVDGLLRGNIQQKDIKFLENLVKTRSLLGDLSGFKGFNAKGFNQIHTSKGLEGTTAGKLRTAIGEVLGLKNVQKMLDFNIEDFVNAVTANKLKGIPKGYIGSSVIQSPKGGTKMQPSPLFPFDSPYSTDFTGKAIAQFPEMINTDALFYRTLNPIKRELLLRPNKKPYTKETLRNSAIGAIAKRKNNVSQFIDNQFTDDYYTYLDELSKKNEYKKGGQVKRKAEGGSIKASPSKLGQEFLGRLGQTAERLGIKLEEAMKIVGQEGNSPIKSFLMNMVVSEPLKSAGTALQDYTGTPRDATEDYPYRRLLSGSGMTTSLDPRAVDVASFAAPVASRVSNAIKHLPTDVMRAAMDAYGPQATASHVIKPKGGNWLAGGVEDRLKRLKRFSAINFGGGRTNENEVSALNNWIDKQLTRYVKNDMGTPEDPIRALAEKGNIHFNPTAVNDPSPSNLMAKRVGAGMPAKGMGQSEAAKNWEDITDRSIKPASAGSYVHGSLDEDIVAQNPWLKKVDPDAEVYYATGLPRDVHFDHLVDELQNAINPRSGLPKELQLRPESLDRLSVQQAVERVAKINEWRAAQKAEADLVRANNLATVTFKEYPEGYRWAELKTPDMPTGIPEGWSEPVMKGNALRTVSPDGDVVLGADLPSLVKNIYARHPETSGNPSRALEDALEYEGEQMGHCVGGGHCPDVEEGHSRIYSLRDAKGQPHVTIEAKPMDNYELRAAQMKREGASPEDIRAFFENPPLQIAQIKGKGNAKPADKYLPFVQDFVKSGEWSDIGDFKNTGLIKQDGQIMTPQEHSDWLLNQLQQPEGMKRGGRVKSAPSLDAMRLATLNKQRK